MEGAELRLSVGGPVARNSGPPSFFLAFHQSEVADGQEIVTVLSDIADYVEKVVKPFIALGEDHIDRVV
jgi:hypothetical protein